MREALSRTPEFQSKCGGVRLSLRVLGERKNSFTVSSDPKKPAKDCCKCAGNVRDGKKSRWRN